MVVASVCWSACEQAETDDGGQAASPTLQRMRQSQHENLRAHRSVVCAIGENHI
jgi:hypothetical protein